jgi:hypothetical protein
VRKEGWFGYGNMRVVESEVQEKDEDFDGGSQVGGRLGQDSQCGSFREHQLISSFLGYLSARWYSLITSHSFLFCF